MLWPPWVYAGGGGGGGVQVRLITTVAPFLTAIISLLTHHGSAHQCLAPTPFGTVVHADGFIIGEHLFNAAVHAIPLTAFATAGWC